MYFNNGCFMRITRAILIFLVSCCGYALAMDQASQPAPGNATTAQLWSIWDTLHPVIAQELLRHNMAIRRQDLAGFPLNDLWRDITLLRTQNAGNLVIKNETGGNIGLEYGNLATAGHPLEFCKWNSQNQKLYEMENGEIAVARLWPLDDSSSPISLKVDICGLKPIVQWSDEFRVDVQQGCCISLLMRDYAWIYSQSGGRKQEFQSCGIGRKVFLKNELDHPIRIRVKDMSNDQYLIDECVNPSGIISCTAFLPLNQLANKKNYPLGIRVWDSQHADEGVNNTGATRALGIDDLMPLKGSASYFAITGFELIQTRSYRVIIKKRQPKLLER